MSGNSLAVESVEMPKDAQGVDEDAEAGRRMLTAAKDTKPTPAANGSR